MERLAIVGSGVIRPDMSDFIDSCEVVIRFNECKNYRQNSGSKVDILCITNSGAPARRIIRGALIRKAPYYSQISEIWFPRHGVAHRNHIRAHAPSFPETELDDLSHTIIHTNELASARIHHFSYQFNVGVFAALTDAAGESFTMPSTGYFALEHVLNDSRFAHYKKYMVGFSFRGWYGHPWKAERKLALSQSLDREDFTLLRNGWRSIVSGWCHSRQTKRA